MLKSKAFNVVSHLTSWPSGFFKLNSHLNEPWSLRTKKLSSTQVVLVMFYELNYCLNFFNVWHNIYAHILSVFYLHRLWHILFYLGSVTTLLLSVGHLHLYLAQIELWNLDELKESLSSAFSRFQMLLDIPSSEQMIFLSRSGSEDMTFGKPEKFLTGNSRQTQKALISASYDGTGHYFTAVILLESVETSC